MPPARGRGAGGRTALLLNKAKQVQNPSDLLEPDILAFQVPLKQCSKTEASGSKQQRPSDGAHLQALCSDAPAQLPRDQDPITSTQEPICAAADTAQQSDTGLVGSDRAGAGVPLRMQHYTAATLPAPLHEWCFQLVKTSLKAMYEPVWGWSDRDKRAQFTAPSSQFLIVWAEPDAKEADVRVDAALTEGSTAQVPSAVLDVLDQPCEQAASVGATAEADRHQDTEPVPVVINGREAAAYLNFRVEEGYDKDPVLYVYEVMVGKKWQRLGLASRLMQAAEHMAWALGMDKVILTVLSANKAAVQLYRALKYEHDKASPPPGKGYDIKSKRKPVEGAAQKAGGGKKGKH